MTIQCKGLILRQVDVGEADRVLTVLAKGRGKWTVSAKGVRKPRSKFLAGAQPFTYSEFTAYDNGRFCALTHADPIKSYYAIAADYETLCYGTYFLELCDKSIHENVPCDDLLLLLLAGLQALAKGDIPPALAARVFEFKFYQLSGLAPEVSRCVACGGEVAGHAYFSPDGLLCGSCAGNMPRKVRLSETALFAIRSVLVTGTPRLFRFRVCEQALAELMAASELFFREHFDFGVKSLEMLES